MHPTPTYFKNIPGYKSDYEIKLTIILKSKKPENVLKIHKLMLN